jgi:CBS domain-containing protein
MHVLIRNILHGRAMFAVEKSETVAEVAAKMATLHVGAILVLENRGLGGIFSERDLMTRVVVEGKDPGATKVGEVMSTNLFTIDENATAEQAMEMMHNHKCRHLPVMRDSEVVGMVSMRDLMDVELERKTEEIQLMRNYIHGNP